MYVVCVYICIYTRYMYIKTSCCILYIYYCFIRHLVKMKTPRFTPVEITVKESNKFFVRQMFLALTNFILLSYDNISGFLVFHVFVS